VANEEHLKIIRQGVAAWNEWREKNPFEKADLSEAFLGGANLSEANLSETNLSEADLSGANLNEANLSRANLFRAILNRARLSGANLSGANLSEAILGQAILIEANLSEAYLSEAFLGGAELTEANLTLADLSGADLALANLLWAKLSGANLSEANLSEADLRGANLSGANLSGANLSEANLDHAILIEAYLSEADLSGALLIGTNLRDATLTGSSVYGVSVWNIKVNDRTEQHNLIITPDFEPVITVDNIEVAQFIYLLLNNQAIRDVIDTITSKAVLILGRFSKKRKPVLDAIRDELRNHNYLPLMFDFDPTANQMVTETVKTLAGMSRFVIADLTDARSVLQELQIIDTHCRTVAIRLIKKRGAREYGMVDFRTPWFVDGRYEYEGLKELIASIKENIIVPAEEKVRELRPGTAEEN
jgi:uncharacterized protein YjbI with pentapeptide repeats